MDLTNYYGICIFIRLSLVYLIYIVYKMQIRYIFALLFFALSVGAMYQYIVKTRKVGAFNNKVWWDYLRPIHSLFFMLTSLGLLYKYKYTFVFLLMDTIIGMVGRYVKK